MGSHLYLNIEVRHSNDPRYNQKNWSAIFDGPSRYLDKGVIVDAFGNSPDEPVGQLSGYLDASEWREMAEHPECPWRLDDPYWVRRIEGSEFVAIVREKRWQKLQDGDFHDLECTAELRAFAALVESLLNDKCDVEVYCWHSQ